MSEVFVNRPARLAGRTAIVTGAGSGIGRATAELFAREGAAVVCADREGSGDATAAAISSDGGRAVGIDVDVRSENDMRRMAACAVNEFGVVDVLFANAGITGVGAAHELSVADWDRVLATNLTGVWLSIRAVLESMLERQSGSIVTTASVGGLVGVPRIAAYAAAKAGVIGLTRQVAIDYASHGIRANVICPGSVLTPLVTQTWSAGAGLGASADLDEAREKASSAFPLGRLGAVEDVANCALFLASEESSWTTGAVFVVDGGMTAR